jgi:hypothetical protein
MENVEQTINRLWNCELFGVDPEPAAGSSDADPAEPAATANQSATAVDAAAGGRAGSAHEGRLQRSAPHLSADNEDKAADLQFTGNTHPVQFLVLYSSNRNTECPQTADKTNSAV